MATAPHTREQEAECDPDETAFMAGIVAEIDAHWAEIRRRAPIEQRRFYIAQRQRRRIEFQVEALSRVHFGPGFHEHGQSRTPLQTRALVRGLRRALCRDFMPPLEEQGTEHPVRRGAPPHPPRGLAWPSSSRKAAERSTPPRGG